MAQQEEWRREELTTWNLTNALGWANVCNRMRMSKESPVAQVRDFLPFETSKNESKVDADEKTKRTLDRLWKESKIPLRVEGFLLQLGLLKMGKENASQSEDDGRH